MLVRSEFACVSMSRHAASPSVCAQTTRMLHVTVAVLVVSDIASVMQPMFLVPVYCVHITRYVWMLSLHKHMHVTMRGWWNVAGAGLG